MAFTAFRGMHPVAQFVFALFVILVCFLAFLLVSAIIAIPVFGLESVLNMSTQGGLTEPKTIALLKYFQVVQSFGAFIVPPFILAWLFEGKPVSYLRLNKKINIPIVLLVVLLVFFANPVVNFIGGLNEKLTLPDFLSGLEDWMKKTEEAAANITEAFLKVNSIPGLLFNLFMIALLPAIGEELLFRGVIQKIFTQWTKNHHWGIWISAIMFSALHLQFYGFFPRLLLGVMFGYLLVWTGSLWVPIIAHFVNNAAAVMVSWIVTDETTIKSFEELGNTPGTYYWVFISVIFTSLALILIYRQNQIAVEKD
jgi:membrane protease YdiL (CAAX protease family)